MSPAAFADAGDYDEITSYVVTVDPRQDGSADITYEIDWSVIGGGSDDYLSWVNIGLANEYADEFVNLTPDTVYDVSLNTDGGSYARVNFHDRYYAPTWRRRTAARARCTLPFRCTRAICSPRTTTTPPISASRPAGLTRSALTA